MLRNVLILVFAISFLFDVRISSAQEFSWAGVWNTKYGVMTLNEFNGLVEGTYTHDGGELKGEVGGNKLFADWNETPTRKGPKDAGKLEFTMSEDGKSFTGRWNYEGDARWRNNWSGTRMTPILQDPAVCKAAKRKAKKLKNRIVALKSMIRDYSPNGRTPSKHMYQKAKGKLEPVKTQLAETMTIVDACQ